MKTDIEISRECNMLNIKEVAKKINIDEKYLECYGNYKAKINLDINKEITKENGKLVLVTSINPTPYGEGKTTVSIGINDSLRSLGKNSLVVLREPSMGPVFGIKGGATGGGYAQVVPMEDINLHFTGDIHAIETANNLLCAIIDNHIFQGNELNIKKVVFNRCIDLNDRALRNIIIKSSYEREDHFNITVASEIMATICMAKDMEDLKNRIGNILIGYNENEEMIFAKDLNCVGAISLVLKDAIKPNLVQTLEGNPAIIHGGPFANIAHGCNSVIATKLGLKLADYVVTEAGFGADLGAEKFLDIKCANNDLIPNCIVINATIRSLKYNGGIEQELDKGIVNLERHIENMSKYTKNLIVCLNKFYNDTEEEINYVREFVNNMGYQFEICDSYEKGKEGSIELSKKIIEICENEAKVNFLYDNNDSIINKINIVCKQIYRASNIIIEEKAKEKLNKLELTEFSKLPICIAKTQYSFSDDSKKLGAPNDFDITVKDIKLNNGAGFIVVLLGNIMTMPGLGKNSAYLSMKIDNNSNITGLF